MKTLKDLFGKKESKNSINHFVNHLAYNEMLLIKGGDNEGKDDDDDNWPPSTTGTGN
ncbi:MAG: hypothetical protein KQH79_12375 [Bacteroidetes bacterium]|nr:hypothetical protein [Bacteroidota bacterium]